jgi:CheY-like chemotaxis protein
MAKDLRVLVAEDQEAEIVIYKHAFSKVGIKHFTFLHDGAEVIRYIKAEGEYADRRKFPFPNWLLLDLKMPRVNGLEVLEWVRSNPHCRIVPTVMMSNSNQPSDIKKAYEIGVNAFFTKPTQLAQMISVLAAIHHFWTLAEVPPAPPDFSCP